MPLPRRRTKEKLNDFVSRCVKFVMDEYKRTGKISGHKQSKKTAQKMATAMCFHQGRKRKK